MIIFNKSVYNRACHILYTLHCVLYDVINIMHILIKKMKVNVLSYSQYLSCLVFFMVGQGSHGHGKSWKTMENEKIKSRPGKVMKKQ